MWRSYELIAAASALRSTPGALSRFAAVILASSGARIAQDDQLLLTIRRAAASLGGVQAVGWEVQVPPPKQGLAAQRPSPAKPSSIFTVDVGITEMFRRTANSQERR